MTVKELIELLKEFDEDLDVMVETNTTAFMANVVYQYSIGNPSLQRKVIIISNSEEP